MRSLAAAVVLLALLGWIAGCGEHAVPRFPTQPPSDDEDLELEWPEYEAGFADLEDRGTILMTPIELHPVRIFRFERHPDGSFRYAWRDARETGSAWAEIRGTWRRDTLRGRACWLLLTDGEAQRVETDLEVGEGLPCLQWSSMLSGHDSADETVARLPPQWIVPNLDPETRRFTPRYTRVTDPRCGSFIRPNLPDGG